MSFKKNFVGRNLFRFNTPIGERQEIIYPQVGFPGPIGTVWEDHPTLSWVSYFLPLAGLDRKVAHRKREASARKSGVFLADASRLR